MTLKVKQSVEVVTDHILVLTPGPLGLETPAPVLGHEEADDGGEDLAHVRDHRQGEGDPHLGKDWDQQNMVC